MRTKGSAVELEKQRRLAVQRVRDGFSIAQVAKFLGVHQSAVRRWWRAFQQYSDAGLAAKPHPGRKPKLTPARERQVLSWLHKNPKSFGFGTELWTARRIAQVIQRKWGIDFNPLYLNAWLTARGITPQKPQRRPRERNDEECAAPLRRGRRGKAEGGADAPGTKTDLRPVVDRVTDRLQSNPTYVSDRKKVGEIDDKIASLRQHADVVNDQTTALAQQPPAAAQKTEKPAAKPAPAQPPPPAGEPVNIRIDLTITDYRWDATAWGWAFYGKRDEKMAQWLKEAERQPEQRARST